MKKINFKLFFALTLISFMVFSVFSEFGSKVYAQTDPPPPEATLLMDTVGYTALTPSTYNLMGYYFMDNYELRRDTGITVYFEYKKVDNQFVISSGMVLDLIFGTDPEKTIEQKYGQGGVLNKDSNVNEQESFQIAADLQSYSRYIFRVVGMFSDNPGTKFYGNTLVLDTGVLPYGCGYPCTYTEPPKKGRWSDWSVWSGCNGDCNKRCVETSTRTCIMPPSGGTYCVGNSVKTRLYPPISECFQITPTNPTDPPSGSSSGLVPCATMRNTATCQFQHIIDLVNNVVNFFFKYLVIPIIAIMAAYAGGLLIYSSFEPEKRSKAKSIFLNVFFGFLIASGAFLIIHTILLVLGAATGEGWEWFGFL